MNLQILSDAVNEIGGKNYINYFTMRLRHPIDAENKNVYISVKNVLYPLTTKNVLENECYLRLRMKFDNFKSDGTSTVKFDTGKVYLPVVIYDIERIVKFVNAHVDEYNIRIEKSTSEKL